MENKSNGPKIGKSFFEETGKTAIELFIEQTTKACEEHGEPLPEIVKNYTPGDKVLYKTTDFGPVKTDSQTPRELLNKAFSQDPDFNQEDFDMVNNNG